MDLTIIQFSRSSSLTENPYLVSILCSSEKIYRLVLSLNFYGSGFRLFDMMLWIWNQFTSRRKGSNGFVWRSHTHTMTVISSCLPNMQQPVTTGTWFDFERDLIHFPIVGVSIHSMVIWNSIDGMVTYDR